MYNAQPGNVRHLSRVRWKSEALNSPVQILQTMRRLYRKSVTCQARRKMAHGKGLTLETLQDPLCRYFRRP